MSRVKFKGPYLEKKLIKDMNKQVFKTFSRQSIIIPKFVGKTIEIYNGKTYTALNIVEEMVGYKLGEFSLTRKKFSYKKKK